MGKMKSFPTLALDIRQMHSMFSAIHEFWWRGGKATEKLEFWFIHRFQWLLTCSKRLFHVTKFNIPTKMLLTFKSYRLHVAIIIQLNWNYYAWITGVTQGSLHGESRQTQSRKAIIRMLGKFIPSLYPAELHKTNFWLHTTDKKMFDDTSILSLWARHIRRKTYQ